MVQTGKASGSFRLRYVLEGTPHEFTPDEPVVTLGRSPECSVVFPESVTGISRHHATISRRPDGWHITDEKSRNGTFVNRAPVETQRLEHGDVVHLGPLEMHFELLDFGAPGDASAGPPRRPQVSFNDGPAPNVSVSINLADMRKTVEAPPAAGTETPHRGAVPSGRYELEEEFPSMPARSTADRAWGIGLFSEIGEALLSSSDLDAMLESILDLVFSNVPGQHGAICLYDEPTGNLATRVCRTRAGAPPQPITISRSIAHRAIHARSSLLVSDASADSRFAEAASIRVLGIASALCVPLYHQGRVGGIIYVDTQDAEAPFDEEHLEVLTALALFSAVAVEQARLRDEVVREQKKREKLSRYHSHSVVEQILHRDAGDDVMLADEKVVSALFADLCGFTSMSERLSPTEVVRLLNSVFELLNSAVFRHGGTLDKFMGDGMLAFFGAPLEAPDHAERAVQAALDMQACLAEYNRGLAPDARIGMRVGVNSGPVIVGDIGSSTRRDYTVIGDTVNVASRLESSVARPGQVVIGPATYELVRGLYSTTPLAPVQLKGKQAPLEPWLVTPPLPDATQLHHPVPGSHTR